MPDTPTPEKRTRPRVLLIDDTELNRVMIGSILSAADFEVDVACDGEAGCAAAWGSSYDLVLMDVEMPGMNGFEAAAQIRAREGVMSGVTIAALTSTATPEAEKFSLWSGMDEFISRPIAAGPLVRRVTQIIAERRHSANDWKPVWRLKVFAAVTKRLSEDEIEDHLDSMMELLSRAATAIHAGATASPDFLDTIDDLLALAARLGFDEVAGICAIYKDTRQLNVGRSRDPNLLGVVERARYAIATYRRDKRTEYEASFWARAQVTVQDLFRRRLAVGTASWR